MKAPLFLSVRSKKDAAAFEQKVDILFQKEPLEEKLKVFEII